jgi:hypothetical protein
MPWKSGHTVYAERRWFEDSKCDYFLTAQLSGCRFVVTGQHVLHIASDVNNADSGRSGSATRDAAEKVVTGGAWSRRLSINGSDLHGYSHLALAFGIRQSDGSWTYKVLKYRAGQAGEWSTLI